jgi:hypothetical protein
MAGGNPQWWLLKARPSPILLIPPREITCF